jgi:thiol-disulfide isomerase/thioredoxin
MNKFFFSIFIVVLPFINFAQVTTSIQGHIPNAGGKKIRIYTNTNLIAPQEIKILEDSIYQNDNFQINLKIEPQQILQIYFAVERFKSDVFFAEAGKQYNIVFNTVEFDNQEYLISPLIPSNELEFILSNDSNELNFLIRTYNHLLDSFAILHLPDIIRTRDRKAFQEFTEFVNSKFQHINHQYFKNYIDYTHAHLQFISRIESRQNLYNAFFHEKPFQHTHPAFMIFFNDFYDSFIYQYSQKISLRDLELHILKQQNVKALSDSLGKDPLLKDEVVREMVLIKNLTQMYYNQLYPQHLILEMMNQIVENTKFVQNKNIASTLRNEMNQSVLPRKTPQLDVRRVDLSKIDMSDYHGRYTYLIFFTTWCTPCLREFTVLERIYHQYLNDINILAVSMDMNFLNFYYFMENNQYEWEFANFAKNFDIEDTWKIKIFPQAFMLNPQGNIIHDHAPLPSNNLENYLKQLLMKK